MKTMLAPGRDKSRRGQNAVAEQSRNGAASRFEVLERVGQSTLWIVYRAKDRTTGQALALKALKGAFNRHPKFVESLYERSERLLDLSHPNVAILHEVGREEGTLYHAVEWLPGGSLESRLLRAPLQKDEIVSILTPLTSGLAYLHDEGVIHGDLRPRQILNDSHGNWKIGDLGISQSFASAGMATADAQPEAAYYLAPERTQGAEASAASDVYSLGIILYRMLAGRVPFDGPSPLAIALRHRSDAPMTPTQLNPKADAGLTELVLRLLDKVPERRPSAADLLSSLEAMSGTRNRMAPPPPVPTSVAAVAAPVAVAAPGIDTPVSPQPAPTRRRQTPVVVPDVDDPAAPPAPAQPLDMTKVRRRHRWREFWGMVGAFVCLLISFGIFGGLFVGAYKYWIDDTPPEVRVPAYTNMTQQEAERILLKKGLTLRVAREIYDPKKPEGTVVNGEPPPGKWVRARREVVVTISQGEKPIRMFNFEGLPLDQARKIIAKYGMRLGQTVEQYDKEPPGYICGQYPEPEQPFRRGEPITLVVSRGPQPSQVDPNEDPLAEIGVPQSTPPSFSTEPLDPSAPPTEGNVPMVRRAAVIKVGVPSDGPAETVRIVVSDETGERTVYERKHEPGDVVAHTVRVTRRQDGRTTVRVYVGDELVKRDNL